MAPGSALEPGPPAARATRAVAGIAAREIVAVAAFSTARVADRPSRVDAVGARVGRPPGIGNRTGAVQRAACPRGDDHTAALVEPHPDARQAALALCVGGTRSGRYRSAGEIGRTVLAECAAVVATARRVTDRCAATDPFRTDTSVPPGRKLETGFIVVATPRGIRDIGRAEVVRWAADGHIGPAAVAGFAEAVDAAAPRAAAGLGRAARPVLADAADAIGRPALAAGSPVTESARARMAVHASRIRLAGPVHADLRVALGTTPAACVAFVGGPWPAGATGADHLVALITLAALRVVAGRLLRAPASHADPLVARFGGA
jgi:hypothetical protein